MQELTLHASQSYPAAHDIESAVLGAILANYGPLWEIIRQRHVTADWFWPKDSAHYQTFQAFEKMVEAGREIELIGATQWFNDKHIVIPPTTAHFLTNLATTSLRCSKSQFNCWLDILQEKMAKRTGMLECEEIYKNLSNGASLQEVHDICNLAFKPVIEMCQEGEKENHDLKELESFVQDMEAAVKGVKMDLFPTTFPILDEESGGMARGEILVIHGLSSTGKSLTSQAFAQYNTFEEKRKTSIFTLEMPEKQYFRRLIANMGSVSLLSMRKGRYDKKEYDGFVRGYTQVEQAIRNNCLTIIDATKCTMTPSAIEARMRKRKKNFGLDVVVIDHLNLVNFQNKSKSESSRCQDLEGFANRMKLLAQELEIVLVLVAQSNKEGTVFDSSQVESSADAVLAMIPEFEMDNGIRRVKGTKGIFVSKFREMRRGWRFPVTMEGRYARIYQETQQSVPSYESQ